MCVSERVVCLDEKKTDTNKWMTPEYNRETLEVEKRSNNKKNKIII